MNLISFVFWCSSFLITTAGYVSYDGLYENALEGYLNNNWKAAVAYFEEALTSYRKYKTGVAKCSRICKDEKSSDVFLNEIFLGKIAIRAACIRECHDEEFGDYRKITRISSESKELFEQLKPYAYLQFAYFKEGQLAKSVSAAYTYSLRFPENKMMKSNMEYYEGNDDVTQDMYVNMEARPHLEKYDAAVQAYLREDYASAVEQFEDALREYYEAEEDCRALCEGEDDLRRDEDEEVEFHRRNADHYIQVLECSLRCVRHLSVDAGEKDMPEFLPVHYHFLQFAYYQLGEIKKGAEYAKTYLVFHPNDKEMMDNLEIFSRKTNLDEIAARKDASMHHKRVRLQAALLAYAYQNFGIKEYDDSLLHLFPERKHEDTEESQEDEYQDEEQEEEESDLEDSETIEEGQEGGPEETEAMTSEPYSSMEEKTNDIIERKDVENERIYEQEKKRRDDENYAEPEDDVDISSLRDFGYQTVDSKYLTVIEETATDEVPIPEGPIMYQGTILLANSSQLRGRSRFAVDGLATEEECLELMDLELGYGKPGDGYGGKPSPHSKHEHFEGVNVLASANLAKQGVLPLKSALLYYELSEKARAQVQAYFKLPRLYFDYTHLVCRTAKAGAPTSRHDLSHPVHADNCLLKSTGECVKEKPAYTWRDFSAILYLNHDFVGGEFLFTDSTARRVRTMVKPKCGRMVSFSAGPESFHGVKPILSGQRCAVALWFTLSKSNDEKQRIEAKKILDELVLRQKDEL